MTTNKDTYPPVPHEPMTLDKSDYVSYGKRWKAQTLVDAVQIQECQVFDLPLCGLDLADMPFCIYNFADFMDHMLRVRDTDERYPIILDWNGYCCEGWHRVGKAIWQGMLTIKAVRLKTMPQWDAEEKKECD